ncbi:MAG TPA: hypothetical protein VNU21_15650 [Usitatibacter sp.]|jgi:hypothetical protein|nr:hypothetical protein [Usitatibacter sp.]
MKPTTFFATIVLGAVVSAGALGLDAAVDSPPTLMSRGDYLDARHGIEAQTRVALAACRGEQDVAREICKARVHGDERIKRAELIARYHGTVAAADDVRIAKVKAHYDVERARCNAREDSDREQCLRAAREGRSREIFARRASVT